MSQPLMPMATAVWLIDNTSLTFKQIARFCGLHDLEVQGIADGTVGQSIAGIDPTANGQLTWDEIRRCQNDPAAALELSKGAKPEQTRTRGPRYTPVSKRQDKPDAISWILRNHPELSDTQISRLVGTTKPTIGAIRDRSHWNIANIRSQDPVALGLCKQSELDEAVKRAAIRNAKAANSQQDGVIKAGDEAEDAASGDVVDDQANSPDEAPSQS
ncbi:MULTISPECIES: cell cycle transcriptional regulator TrcR [unclassified Iodidimonas]|uniref:DUF1013 domain-containing protein n=1 Tax=unclassified Iodidimonas TaxID=2626145 RepID=UPI0024830E31|nr:MULTISPECIES: cell cycle transcriptional regulator TrcR [unclassified Iodidimonas]